MFSHIRCDTKHDWFQGYVTEVNQTVYSKDIKIETLKCAEINLKFCFYLKITDVTEM